MIDRLGRGRGSAFLLALACFSGPAMGQNPAQTNAAAATPAAVAPASECELHVWGAERFQSMTTGWLSGFGAIGGALDGAVHADRDSLNRSLMGEALSTPGQVTALSSLDLPTLLHAAARLPDYPA